MDIKLFEIRDRGTFIPVMATRLRADPPTVEHWLIRQAGYAKGALVEPPTTEIYVILTKLDGVEAQYDAFAWKGGSRTMGTAHRHIIAHWNDLASGDVIDVEYIEGEVSTPKVSQRHDY